MALAERAALGVLAGQADRDALDQQRRERERFALRPVDAALGPDVVALLLQLLDELRVDREAVGRGQQLGVELAQAVGRDRRLDGRAGRAVELILAGRLLDAP